MKNSLTSTARAAALASATFGLVVLVPHPAWAEAKKTPFTVHEVFTNFAWGIVLTDGTSVFSTGTTMAAEEVATDPRVSGMSTGTIETMFDMMLAGPMWGGIRYENVGGWWAGYWRGTRTPFLDAQGKPHVLSEVWVTATGGGGYEGLVACWNYNGVDTLQTGVFDGNGYIVEAKGGPGDRPLQVKATRVDRLQLHPCMVIDPLTFKPTGEFAVIGTADIVEEVGETSHTGRYTNRGSGLVDPATGTVSAMGTLTAANTDLLYWVAEGIMDLKTGVFDGGVHFMGGTGRFQDAVGGFDGQITEQMGPTEDPMVFLSRFSYSAKGTIRY